VSDKINLITRIFISIILEGIWRENMGYPRLIAITGIDGSGKTTICRYLVAYLNVRGYKTKHVWMRSLHTLAYNISKIIEYLSGSNLIMNPNNKRIKRFNYSHYAGIWPYIEFISIIPLIIFKIHFPLLLGYTLIADRCTIDTVITIATYLHDPSFIKRRISKILLSTIPKESLIIFFETDIQTILKRKPNIEFTESEIKSQIMLYDVLTKTMGVNRVVTSNVDINETFKAVHNIIKNNFREN